MFCELEDVNVAQHTGVAELWPGFEDAPDPLQRVLTRPFDGQMRVSLKNGVTMDANLLTAKQWSYLQQWAETERDDDDGYYTMNQYDRAEDIEVPDCGVEVPGVIEVTATNTVSGNSYDSNADTYGAMMGKRAQTMYVFFIPHQGEFGVIRYHYWCW